MKKALLKLRRIISPKYEVSMSDYKGNYQARVHLKSSVILDIHMTLEQIKAPHWLHADHMFEVAIKHGYIKHANDQYYYISPSLIDGIKNHSIKKLS